MSLEQQGWEGNGITGTLAWSLPGTGGFKCRSVARRKQLVSAPNINTAVTTWNTVSFPVIGPIQRAGLSQLRSTSLPALSRAALGSGSKPLASNQVTPAGCTDGAAGQNFYKDMCPGQLEGPPRLEEVDPRPVVISG